MPKSNKVDLDPKLLDKLSNAFDQLGKGYERIGELMERAADAIGSATNREGLRTASVRLNECQNASTTLPAAIASVNNILKELIGTIGDEDQFSMNCFDEEGDTQQELQF